MSRGFIDSTGQRFGRLSVICRAPDFISKNGRKHVRYLCRCDCGATVLVQDGVPRGQLHNLSESLESQTQTTVKNQLAGDLGIAAIGAAQATSAGRVADSAKIGRNASTICLIQDKTPEEIETDGPECGNKKLTVVLNRNGMQHASGEYIDLKFDGNHVLYEEAKQHIPQLPY